MASARSIIVGVAGTAMGIAAVGLAGPLSPPSGPVAPTYKTLAEIEPRTAVQSLGGDAAALYVITEPGSYYLTGPIAGVAGKAGIKIACSDVTLDLSGFTPAGPGSGSQQSGVLVALVGVSASRNITVRNGTLRDWTYGVNGFYADNARIERLSTSANSTGIQLSLGGLITDCVSHADTNAIFTSGFTQVARCVVRDPGANGIHCNTDMSVVTECLVESAGNTGIVCGSSSIVSRCTVRGSTFYGIHLTSFGGEVRDCTSDSNGHHGIHVGVGSLVAGNTCRLNGGAIADGSGVYVSGADNRIEGNNLLSNDRGVTTAVAGSLVIRNSTSGNATAYSFAAGTVAGPTVNSATIATNTNPHANYDF